MTLPAPLAPEEFAAQGAGRVIVDVRDADSFACGHLPGSGHVALESFTERRAELPPRGMPVLVVACDAARADAAARALAALGFTDVRWLDAPPDAVPNVAQVRDEAARLWRPSPFLVDVLPRLPRVGRALDLASGSGRDAVWLALHGLETEAWDIDALAIGRARALAARSGVVLGTLICDLEQTEAPLPQSRWDVIVCFRFLHRPLLPRIARALAPGGHLVYETYRRGQE